MECSYALPSPPFFALPFSYRLRVSSIFTFTPIQTHLNCDISKAISEAPFRADFIHDQVRDEEGLVAVRLPKYLFKARDKTSRRDISTGKVLRVRAMVVLNSCVALRRNKKQSSKIATEFFVACVKAPQLAVGHRKHFTAMLNGSVSRYFLKLVVENSVFTSYVFFAVNAADLTADKPVVGIITYKHVDQAFPLVFESDRTFRVPKQ